MKLIKKLYNKIFKPKTELVSTTVTFGHFGQLCPKCKEDGGLFLIIAKPAYYLCENCQKTSTPNEVEKYQQITQRKFKLEKIITKEK